MTIDYAQPSAYSRLLTAVALKQAWHHALWTKTV